MVIRKEIRTRSEDSENEEERILHSLRVLMHPNIIRVLASYSYTGVHSLLFPVADGDLEGLLRGKVPRDKFFPNDHTILRELHGLSSALKTIHSFFVGKFDLAMIGCHYDLKPKNILLRGKRFLLTDFGMSRLEAPSSRGGVSSIRYRGYYYAPECILEAQTGQKAIVGRESDVWSFGCILAVVAEFLENGPSGVAKFESERRAEMHVNGGTIITSTFHIDGALNPGFLLWLKRMKANSGTSLVCTMEFLATIEQCIQVDIPSRPTIVQVTENLAFVAQKSVFDFSHQWMCKILGTPTYVTSRLSDIDESGRIELDTEVKRYYIWGKTLELTGRESDSTNSHQYITDPELLTGEARGFLSDVSLSRTLVEIENEILFIESWSSRLLSPSYFRLRCLVDELWAYLPERLQQEMRGALESAIVDGATENDLMNISDTLQADQSCDYKAIGALAEFKFRSGEALTANADEPEKPIDKLMLGTSEFSLRPDGVGTHSLGEILAHHESNGPVLIEWVKYSLGWDDKILSRYTKVARLFNNPVVVQRAGLRVLQCVGYHQDDAHDRLGIFFRIPCMEPPARPVTLRELIQDTSLKARYLRPALGDLFELAYKISLCILEVHKVGLVHKSISSYNIIFFPTGLPSAAPLPVTMPYVIGFNQSRRESSETFTEGSESSPQHRAYQHPEYSSHDHGFRPHHDYYSLGLILLEIGRWKTLRKLIKGMEEQSSWDRAKAMLRECDENLANSMGVYYRDAVRACLASEFTIGRGVELVREEFEAKVVNRLARCVA